MIVDTDFAIWFLKKDKKTLEKFNKLIESKVRIYTTHITAWELYKGAYMSSKKEDNVIKVKKFLKYIPILPFTQEIDERFASLHVKLEENGNRIGVMDTLIASIALEHDFPVLTRNITHFEKTGIKIESW